MICRIMYLSKNRSIDQKHCSFYFGSTSKGLAVFSIICLNYRRTSTVNEPALSSVRSVTTRCRLFAEFARFPLTGFWSCKGPGFPTITGYKFSFSLVFNVLVSWRSFWDVPHVFSYFRISVATEAFLATKAHFGILLG